MHIPTSVAKKGNLKLKGNTVKPTKQSSLTFPKRDWLKRAFQQCRRPNIHYNVRLWFGVRVYLTIYFVSHPNQALIKIGSSKFLIRKNRLTELTARPATPFSPCRHLCTQAHYAPLGCAPVYFKAMKGERDDRVKRVISRVSLQSGCLQFSPSQGDLPYPYLCPGAWVKTLQVVLMLPHSCHPTLN